MIIICLLDHDRKKSVADLYKDATPISAWVQKVNINTNVMFAPIKLRQRGAPKAHDRQEAYNKVKPVADRGPTRRARADARVARAQARAAARETCDL